MALMKKKRLGHRFRIVVYGFRRGAISRLFRVGRQD